MYTIKNFIRFICAIYKFIRMILFTNQIFRMQQNFTVYIFQYPEISRVSFGNIMKKERKRNKKTKERKKEKKEKVTLVISDLWR